jgi:hypothetical protein
VLRGEVSRQNWEIPLEPRVAGAAVPLAPDQYLIWLSAEMAGAEPAYNEPITIHYRGALDRKLAGAIIPRSRSPSRSPADHVRGSRGGSGAGRS